MLQVCHAEPAVRHAVLALGAYHSFIAQRDDSAPARQHLLYADKQYRNALSEARALLAAASSQKVNRVLMVCVLFILYEGMRGNYRASQAHMSSGRAIMAQYRQSQPGVSHGSSLNEIVEVMARLDIFALTFSEATAPYPYKIE